MEHRAGYNRPDVPSGRRAGLQPRLSWCCWHRWCTMIGPARWPAGLPATSSTSSAPPSWG